MLKLSSQSAEPYWLDLLPGVRVKVKPITVAAMLVARRPVGKVFADAAAVEDAALNDDTTVQAGIVMVRELARYGIVEWEGVGDANDDAAPVTVENIDMALQVWPFYRALDEKYVGPAWDLDAEKNGSANAPSGTSGTTGTRTAAPAA